MLFVGTQCSHVLENGVCAHGMPSSLEILMIGIVISSFVVCFSVLKHPKKRGPLSYEVEVEGIGRFDVCSSNVTLRCLRDAHFPWKSIWYAKAPKRASFFLWIAA